MTRRARALAVALAMSFLAACSGPAHTIDIGVKEITTDVLIGPKGATIAPSAPPSSSPSVGFPGLVEPPPPPVPGPPPPPGPACPTASPISPVRHEVTATSDAPPVGASYTYRNGGSYTVGGRSYMFPSTSTRAVQNINPSAQGGGYTFDVAITQPDASTTTTTYHVYPSQATPADQAAGMYIDQIVTTHPRGATETFQPTPPIMLIPFPAAVGKTWTTRGIDPLAQIVMQFDGKISATAIDDACGTRVAAWRVDITNGTIRSPTTDLTLAGRLDIGTQYGGIFVLDSLTEKGTDNNTPVDITATARIAEEPESP